jgi:RNA polymerase primary sigma factor
MKTLLEDLVRRGQERGYLTYSQVSAYLPPEPPDPERLDRLLMLLEDHGIELVDDEEAAERGGNP